MGSFFSSKYSIFSEENLDNRKIQDFNRDYIAIDQSGSLGLLFDNYRDAIIGKPFIDFKSRLSKVNETITCELYKGLTPKTTNLLEIVEIDYLSQLTILAKVILPTGIASIINYSRPIDEYTRFLYVYQRSFYESCYDDLLVSGKAFSLSMSETPATDIITEISWGIHLMVVLQLPINQTAEIDQFLEQICYSLISDEYHVEMGLIEKSLFNQIKFTTVYSNIPELVTLTRLDDVYQRILEIRTNTSEHRRLRYVLNSLQSFRSDYHEDNGTDGKITPEQIKEVNRYLYQQFSQMKTLKFRLDNESDKPSQNKLEEQWNNFRRDFSRLIKLYESDAQKMHHSIQSLRKGELIMHSVDEFFGSEAQRQIKDLIQKLITSLDKLTSKGNVIKQLEMDKIEYCNIARFGIDRDYEEQLIKDILFKNNQKKIIFCSTDQLKQQSSDQWNSLYSQIIEERRNNPQLNLIYADFTYSTWLLEKMIILSSKDQSILKMTSSPSTNEYINILLFGDSGVGKSTFINAFANYLQFNSLQQAQSGRPIVIIPVSFLMTVNDDFDEQRIKFGEPDPNEQHNEIGQSVTQQCRSYVFEISPGKKLRIIDTPGLADTRGDSQDILNMNMIFSFMNNLTHLNAVCLLFKPNIARLNPFLYTYFTQIFQCFGDDIRNHLIFCFTNARSTFFTPGDTRPLLKAFFNSFPVKNIPFEKKNTFCFDSESFRYLVALQDGFKFNDMEENEMKNSWIRSVEESKRLRSFLCKELQPYCRNIQWQSIQNAQYQIMFMIRPMLETIRNILRNILLYEMNCSIQLKATCVHRPTIICYNCDRIPKVLHQFTIFPDLIHHDSSNECSSNEQILTEYTLDYESLNSRINESENTLNQQQILLCKTCVKFARFLLSTNARKDDPFLYGLIRILNEEESICQKQNENNFNKQLSIHLRKLIEEYKQLFDETHFDSANTILLDIYESIRAVNEVPMMKEQIDAIREYQQFLLTSNEHNIETQTISL